jgi:hypothetical protein
MICKSLFCSVVWSIKLIEIDGYRLSAIDRVAFVAGGGRRERVSGRFVCSQKSVHKNLFKISAT